MTRMELRGGEGSGERWFQSVEQRLRQLERFMPYVPGTAQQLVVGNTPVNVALVPPSTPTATNDQPQVYLTWNGLGIDDQPLPINFREVVVYRGPDPDFVPSDIYRMGTMRGAGTLVFADGDPGVPYWFRLVATNTEGQESTASTAVMGTRTSGPVGLPVYASSGRPTPTQGSMIYDSTLLIPLFGDGVVWRKSDGTIV